MSSFRALGLDRQLAKGQGLGSIAAAQADYTRRRDTLAIQETLQRMGQDVPEDALAGIPGLAALLSTFVDPTQLVVAWARITTDGASGAVIDDGVGFTSAAIAGVRVRLTYARAMQSWIPFGGVERTTGFPVYGTAGSANQIDAGAQGLSLNTSAATFGFALLGRLLP